MAALPDGGFLIADDGNGRVREVDPAGLIHTVAGDGREGMGGDGGPAARAHLSSPLSLLTNADGSWLVGDANGTIRRVAPDGTISTVVGAARDAPMLTGHGIGIFNGEGLVASHAAILPIGLARAGDGSLLIANDYGRVVAITEAESASAAVAITGTRVSPRRLTVEFTSTVAGRRILPLPAARLTPRSGMAGRPSPCGRRRSRGSIASSSRCVRHRTPSRSPQSACSSGLSAPESRAMRSIVTPTRRRKATATSRAATRSVPGASTARTSPTTKSCLSMNAITTGASGLVRFRNYDCSRRGRARFRLRPRWWTTVSDGTFPPFGRLGVLPGPLLGPI